MVEIQQADIEADQNDKNFHSDDWETLIETDTATDALISLVGMVNADELDDVNRWYRVVNTNTEKVY